MIEGEADAIEAAPAQGAAAMGVIDGTTKEGDKMDGMMKGYGIGG